MSEIKVDHQPPFEWVPADWPDPMQEWRDKADAGDKIAALIVERVDGAAETVLADVLPKWEALMMKGGDHCALGDLLNADD